MNESDTLPPSARASIDNTDVIGIPAISCWELAMLHADCVVEESMIEPQGWGLNRGRREGVAARMVDDFDFFERPEELNKKLEVLNGEARELEERIAENVAALMETPA